jgi:hypothetical protein
VHEDISIAIVEAESHVSIKQVVDVVGTEILILEQGFVDQVSSTDERDVPQAPTQK